MYVHEVGGHGVVHGPGFCKALMEKYIVALLIALNNVK